MNTTMSEGGARVGAVLKLLSASGDDGVLCRQFAAEALTALLSVGSIARSSLDQAPPSISNLEAEWNSASAVHRTSPEGWKEQGPYRVWAGVSSGQGKQGPAAFSVIIRNAVEQEKVLVGWQGQTSSHEADLRAVTAALEEVPSGSSVHITTLGPVTAEGFNKWLPKWRSQDWRSRSGVPIAHPLLWRRIADLAKDRDVTVERATTKSRVLEARRATLLAQVELVRVTGQ